MVNLKNAEPISKRAAIRICVQARAQHNQLLDAALNCGRERIFREARAHGDEESHPTSRWMLLRPASHAVRILTQYLQRQWVSENAPLFQNLMRRAVPRRCNRRPAWCARPHSSESTKVLSVITCKLPPSPGKWGPTHGTDFEMSRCRHLGNPDR